MIDPNWSVVDLDPLTWRNIGRFFDPEQYVRAAQPGERGLFVLHDDGRLLRVVDTQAGVRRDLDIDDCQHPQELAERLLALEEWDRVHVINKRHLADVARLSQSAPQRDLALDGYYRRVFHLLWDDSAGYVALPPHAGHWHAWTYAGLQGWVDRLPAAASVALGVLDGAAVSIGLILELRDGLVRRVTTFEALDLPAGGLRLSAAGLDQLWSSLAEVIAPPAGVLLCTPVAFEAWVNAADKAASLRQARAQGAALWRLSAAWEEKSVP